MREPGGGGWVQDKARQVVLELRIKATTGEDETVRSEDGDMSIEGKGQGSDRTGAFENLGTRKDKTVVIIIDVVRIALQSASDDDD